MIEMNEQRRGANASFQPDCSPSRVSATNVVTVTGNRQDGKSNYVPYIDGLRAVAVLSVLAYHLNSSFLPGGFIGVDIFFVISGFVVSASVAQQEGTTLPKFLGYFYARRLFRIAPAVIVCLLVTSAVFALLVPSSWLSSANQDTGLAAFFGLGNFVLARTNNDYFSPLIDFNPFTHTWSLGIEEQFYLTFPLVFIVWLNRRRRLSTAVIAAGFAVSLLWARHLAVANPARAFYMITSRFWELAAGVLLYQLLALRKATTPLRPWLATLGASISAVLLVIGFIVVVPATTPFPGGILPVLGTLGILGFLHGGAKGGPILKLLALDPLRFIGKISYSLYLWHWPVFVLFRWTYGLQSVRCKVAAVVLAFALSVASFYFVETPPRRLLAAWRFPRYAAVAVGVVALLIGYGISSGIWKLQPKISLSTVTQHRDDWYPDAPVTNVQNPECVLASQPIDQDRRHLKILSRTGCAAPVTFPHQLFVFGDSHSLGYWWMIRGFVLQTGAHAFLSTIDGCSPLNLNGAPPARCVDDEAASVKEMLSKAEPGDVLFLAALRLPRMVDQYTIFGEAIARAAASDPGHIAALHEGEVAALPVLQSFAAKGVKIVFEGPKPLFNSVTYRCADWYDRTNPICAGGDSMPRSVIDQLRAPVLNTYRELQGQLPSVSVWDPMPILCPGERCSEYQNRVPLFLDGDHPSGYANRILLPSFSAFVKGLDGDAQ